MRTFLFLRLLKRSAVLAVLPLVLFANIAVAAVTTPNYVQGNYAVSQNSQTSVTVPYTAAQGAGDLNVAIIAWNDTTAEIISVTDSAGNRYSLAGAPVREGALASQCIYYADNISSSGAGLNTVTVTFNRPATSPGVRILEYSGIDPNSPVDVSAHGHGHQHPEAEM